MLAVTYRLIRSIIVVVYDDLHETLQTLNRGSVIVISSADQDYSGMIEATFEGRRVRLFARDLEERGERIEAESEELKR